MINAKLKIYLGADHRGFNLKEKISRWLFEWGYKFTDMGAMSLDPGDDYTKYAELVGSVVAKENASQGVLICGSGVGVEVAANKFDGVRASIGKNKKQVEAGRRDDNMNILVIASDYTKDDEAREMLKSFLETKYEKLARRERRLDEISRLEQNN